MSTTPTILHQFTLSETQRAAATAQGNDVVVTAGAGTGKTRTLVARFLSLLDAGTPLRHIVAITFTRKAAQEMRNRVRQEVRRYLENGALDDESRAWWEAQLMGLDAARIGTIHTLCSEILRTHPAEAGVDPRFEVLEEGRGNLLRATAVETGLAWAAESPEASELFALLGERPLADLIDRLLQQRLAVAACLEQAPDGLLGRWQAALHAQQAQALDSLTADPAWQEAVATLRRHEATRADDRMEENRRLALTALAADPDETLAGRLRNLAALDAINLRGGSMKAWPGGKAERDVVKNAVTLLRDQWRDHPLLALQLNDQDKKLAGLQPVLAAVFRAAAGAYARLKEERNALDFDDLEAGAIHLLQENEAVRRHWQGVVRALLVDEFQDTSSLQLTLIRLLCPDPGKLFLVGDAKQSIYRFRNADVAVFRAEQARIAAKNGRLHDLATSYRAHHDLVEAMNELLRPVLGENDKHVPAYVAPFAPLRPHRQTPDDGLRSPFVELHLTVGSKSDGALARAARAIAARLAKLVAQSDLRFSDVAILCRASSSFSAYEDALDAAGIPYVTVAGKGFYDRPEVRDLLNSLQALANPTDDLALAGLLRSPACGLSDVALYELVQARRGDEALWTTLRRGVAFSLAEDAAAAPTAVTLIEALNAQVGRTAVADLLKAFLDRTAYRAALRYAGQERGGRNVAKLLADAHSSNLVSVGAFLEYVNNLRESGSREGEARATADGAVQIMTIHAAKGLEFSIVILGDAGYDHRPSPSLLVDETLGILLKLEDENGVAPAVFTLAVQQEKDRDLAEQKRLLYVAATRAEDKLLINGSMSLKTNRQPSLRGWLKELGAIAGLDEQDYSAYDEAGAQAHQLRLRVGDAPLACTVYEPHCEVTAVLPPQPAEPTPPDAPVPPPLLAPLAPGETAVAASDEPLRVPGIIHSGVPPALIGKLVHEALAVWRFPDAQFTRWFEARARTHGLSEGRLLQEARRQVVQLLGRLRDHALYEQMAQAERRLHEAPYALTEDRGVIDVLFFSGGQWTAVEVKTETVTRSDVPVNKHYQQAQRYGTAVRRLLGVVPRLCLCYLDCDGAVHVCEVALDD